MCITRWLWAAALGLSLGSCAWVGNVGLGYLYCQPAGSTPYVPASQPDHETADHAHIEFSNFLSIEAIRHPTS